MGHRSLSTVDNQRHDMRLVYMGSHGLLTSKSLNVSLD